MNSTMSKELPTRGERHKRTKNRKEVSEQLHFDEEHKMKVQNSKTTQTMDGNNEISSQYSEVIRHLSRNSPVTSASSPTQPPEAPLNLTRDGATPPLHPRQTVITSASVPPVSEGDEPECGPIRRDVISGICDSSIDEHFRRSLSKRYPTDFPGTENSISSSEDSVDDHFSRSLGKTWDDIKAKNDTTSASSSRHVTTDVLSDSVDDHFAKALGKNWSKLKAQSEAENTPDSSSSSSESHSLMAIRTSSI
ncbi:uncharacterized protein LOC141901903 isoform X2 [Tubulanus polymorphus]